MLKLPRNLTVSLLLFASFFVVSCTSDKDNSASDTLRLALSAEPKTLDPRYATDAAGMRLSHLMFNSLVRLGPELKLVLDAAESYTYKNLEYTFVLKPGLKFHNGSAVTAKDITGSFEQYRTGKSPFRSSLNVIDTIKTSEKGGKITLKIKLKHFSATFLTDLSPVKILPIETVKELGDDFAKKPIGTGSLKLVSRSANEIKFERVPDHPILTAKSKNVVFKIVRDDTTRVLKLRKGELDLIQNEVPPNKIAAFEKNSDFVVHKFPGLSMSYLLINLKDPALKQVDVRKAIAKAINRDEIIKYKLNGLAQKASSILTPANPFFHQAKLFSFDLSGATELFKRLLKEAPQLTLKTSNNQTAVQNGQILADQISKAGLKVDLKSFEWGTFYSDIKKGQFQLATMRWVGATDPDIYRIAFHSQELPPNGRNRGHYINNELDQLVQDGTQIENPEQRIQHYRRVQEIVQQDLPIIPLWYDKQVAIVRKGVKGYKAPLNGDYTPVLWMHK